MHADCPLALVNFPAGHRRQPLAPRVLLYVPSGHLSHSSVPVRFVNSAANNGQDSGGTTSSGKARQEAPPAWHCSHTLWPAVLNVPAGQATHVALPLRLWNVPAPHLAHTERPAPAANRPGPQAVHESWPFAMVMYPALQLVHAETPSAFLGENVPGQGNMTVRS